MLAETVIRDLGALGIDARWTRLSGVLEAEAPSAIKHMQTFGLCRVGALTYSDYGVDVYDTDIGRYCSIGSGVKINPGDHSTSFFSSHPFAKVPSDACGLGDTPLLQAIAATSESKPDRYDGSVRVAVEHDVWIGTNAVVLRGVTIGTGAVIGAGAIVTKDVEPYAIVAGVPARTLRYRFDPGLIERLLASRWWRRDLRVLGERDYSDPRRVLDSLDKAANLPFEPQRVRIEASGFTLI